MDKDYLQRRAQELGLGREDVLAQIQRWLDAQYPSRCRALSLNDGLLRLVTPESAVASELRLRQVELLQRFQAQGVAKVAITIRG